MPCGCREAGAGGSGGVATYLHVRDPRHVPVLEVAVEVGRSTEHGLPHTARARARSQEAAHEQRQLLAELASRCAVAERCRAGVARRGRAGVAAWRRTSMFVTRATFQFSRLPLKLDAPQNMLCRANARARARSQEAAHERRQLLAELASRCAMAGQCCAVSRGGASSGVKWGLHGWWGWQRGDVLPWL